MLEFVRKEKIPTLEANKPYLINDININEINMTSLIIITTLMVLFVTSIRLITISGTF